MIRRDFCKTSLAVAGWTLRGAAATAGAFAAVPTAVPAGTSAAAELPHAPGLTKYVSEFIVNTKYEDIPGDVIALGKKRFWMDSVSRSQAQCLPPAHTSGNTSKLLAFLAAKPA